MLHKDFKNSCRFSVTFKLNCTMGTSFLPFLCQAAGFAFAIGRVIISIYIHMHLLVVASSGYGVHYAEGGWLPKEYNWYIGAECTAFSLQNLMGSGWWDFILSVPKMSTKLKRTAKFICWGLYNLGFEDVIKRCLILWMWMISRVCTFRGDAYCHMDSPAVLSDSLDRGPKPLLLLTSPLLQIRLQFPVFLLCFLFFLWVNLFFCSKICFPHSFSPVKKYESC